MRPEASAKCSFLALQWWGHLALGTGNAQRVIPVGENIPVRPPLLNSSSRQCAGRITACWRICLRSGNLLLGWPRAPGRPSRATAFEPQTGDDLRALIREDSQITSLYDRRSDSRVVVALKEAPYPSEAPLPTKLKAGFSPARSALAFLARPGFALALRDNAP